MLASALLSPPLHGELGVVDELLLFCLPLVVVLVILATTAQRARRKEERMRSRAEALNHRDTEGTEKTEAKFP